MSGGATETSATAETLETGAWAAIRRGIASSPDLRSGVPGIVALALMTAITRMVAPVLLQITLDRGLLGDTGIRPGLVVVAAVIGFAVIVATCAAAYVLTRQLLERAERAVAHLRMRAFEHVHRLSISDHNETRRGILLARVTSDANAVGLFIEWSMLQWVSEPIVLVGTFILLAVYSWQLALVALCAYGFVLPVVKLFQREIFASNNALRTAVGSMLATFSESLAGAETVRAYGMQDRIRSNLRASTTATYVANMRANRYMAGVFVIGDVFGVLAFAGVLVCGVAFGESWGISAGELTACLFLTTMLQEPIGGLGESLGDTQAAAAGWSKILDLLDTEIEVVESSSGRLIPSGPVAIEVRDVTFNYRGSAAPALRNLTIDLAAGQSIAVVGETGSGKSTFAKLLCRLADPTSGEIRLSDVPLTEVSAASRLASVRMVPQDGFLFDRSVGENIRLGREGASDLDVEAAIDKIGLQSWVDGLTDGLATEVGEGGSELSVGERQLVALARAAVADPGLLILDEATSAVDPQTDQALTTAIRRLAENRTLVSIAHRLATAESADLILVFADGDIVETGCHADLVKADGVYAQLHQAWTVSTAVNGRG